MFFTLIPAGAGAQTSDEVVLRDAVLFLDIYGQMADTVYVTGTSTFQWGERYFNGMTDVIDTELIASNLHGEIAGFCISFNQHPTLPSPGKIEFPGPGGDFPAESFFDVYFEVVIPDMLPGDTLHTVVPLHIIGMTDGVPPYFSPHGMFSGPVILYDQFGAPRGEIASWEEEMFDYLPPEAYITAETSYGTDIAISTNDTVTLHAAVAGYFEPLPGVPVCMPTEPFSAEFGIRETGLPGPFMPFYLDTDGLGGEIGTIENWEDGDGWAGYLDIGPYPIFGGYYDIEVVFDFGPYDMRDTITLWLDPTSIVPKFVDLSADSVACFDPDEIGRITLETGAENAANANLAVQPLAANWQRSIVNIYQYDMTTSEQLGSIMCGPTAAAACLKFWAKNGYPKIEHPKGNTARDTLTNRRIARSLAHDMGMTGRSRQAPKIGKIEGGIKKYLKKHKMPGWKVAKKEVNNSADLAAMMREFEADSEDVIVIMSDTTREGGKLVNKGHAVTMSSRKAAVYKKSSTGGDSLVAKQRIDFMDPEDGSGGDQNDHEIENDSNGHPRTKGYSNANNIGSDSRIAGYIKVSPPSGGGGSPPAGSVPAWRGTYDAPQDYASPLYGSWIIVDSRPCSGNGIPDTLYWDTTGFPAGLYLLEVRTTDMDGRTGTALTFAGIPQYTVDSNEPVIPPIRTGIRSSFPNPFNPSTTIEYNVSRREDVTLSVYDVGGRLVSVLVEGETKDPGVYRTVWDGSNRAGNRVASGVYFAVISSPGGISSRKMILLR